MLTYADVCSRMLTYADEDNATESLDRVSVEPSYEAFFYDYLETS